MDLMTRYDAAVGRAEIKDSPKQRQVLNDLQCLSDALVKPARSWWGMKKSVKGLYLYGPVGVGNT